MTKRKPKARKIDAVTGLADRDIDILKLMAVFTGKTFNRVLAETFFDGLAVPEQQARDRIQKLKSKYGIIKFVPTGLMTPRNTIALSDAGRRVCEEIGIDAKYNPASPVTINHLMMEQITYYWLTKTGREIERITAIKWREKHAHSPDMLYYKEDGGLVYVEVENSKKTPNAYLKILTNMKKDAVDRVIYVFEDDKKMEQIGRLIPMWKPLYYTTIDMLKIGGRDGKINAIKQSEFLEKLDSSRKTGGNLDEKNE